MSGLRRCFVIGGGVVGLAVARALSFSAEVLLIEATGNIGKGTSSRNSEVIHSGIYYQKNSLKEKLSVSGAEALYKYMTSRQIAHNRCGKIIVASSPEEVYKLDRIIKNGEQNGVLGLRKLSAADIKFMEPQVTALAGILVPSTGIVNSHELMLSLQADAEANGAVVVLNCEVQGVKYQSSGGNNYFTIETSQGNFDADNVVNCAGHGAPALAARTEGHPIERVPRPYYCKGNYFKLSGNLLNLLIT